MLDCLIFYEIIEKNYTSLVIHLGHALRPRKKKTSYKNIPKSVFSCVFTNHIFFSLFVFHSLINRLVWISSFYSCNNVSKVVMLSSVLIII